MRALPDRRLPEPYRAWIDRGVPLPSGVQVLPRTVDLGSDALAFLSLGVMFGVMSALFVLLPPWRFDPATEGGLFPPEKSRDGRKKTLVIETLDGVVEFFAERLDAHPERINTEWDTGLEEHGATG